MKKTLTAVVAAATIPGTLATTATDDSAHMTFGYMVADGGYNMVGA